MPPLRPCVANEGGVHALSHAEGEVPPVPGTPADINGGIAKAFFPTEAARAGHYRDLDVILGQLLGRKNFGEVLELGASGGAWTWGLAHDDRVRRLYATETSPAALAHLAEITADGAALILETATDGLAIEMASLDLVVGRGALSREADPTPLLTNVKRWLKPGGVAVFLEPCLQGKIWTAFVMDLIRRFEAQGGPGPAQDEGGTFLGRKAAKKGMSQLATMRLEGAARQVMRGAQGEGTGDDRVFDMAALTNLGYESAIPNATRWTSRRPTSRRSGVCATRSTGLLGQEKSALDRYTPIFEALEETFGALPETAPVAPTSISSSAPDLRPLGPWRRAAPVRIFRKDEAGDPALHLSPNTQNSTARRAGSAHRAEDGLFQRAVAHHVIAADPGLEPRVRHRRTSCTRPARQVTVSMSGSRSGLASRNASSITRAGRRTSRSRRRRRSGRTTRS
jgi:SAM-dependent methyltransferase